MLCILNRLKKKRNGFDRKSVYDRWGGPNPFLWRLVEEAIDKKYGERFSCNELFVCASRSIWELSERSYSDIKTHSWHSILSWWLWAMEYSTS